MPLDEKALNGTLQHAVELFVNPEIERRHREGKIASLPLALWGFQVILPGDGGEARVRLNDEIRGAMRAVTKPGAPSDIGTQVSLQDLAAIESLVLTDAEDLNAGHITAIWLGESVFLGFDFRRNKDLTAKLVAASAEFLESARHAKDDAKSWSVFVDNLYSSLELSVKAFLWTMPWGKDFKARMPHTVIRSTFGQYPTSLNNMTGAADALEELAKERNVARYLHDDPKPNWEKGEAWFVAGEQMLERARGQVETSI